MFLGVIALESAVLTIPGTSYIVIGRLFTVIHESHAEFTNFLKGP